MKKKTLYRIITFILVVLMFLYANSYTILLIKEGFDPRHADVVYSGIQQNGDQYQVVSRSVKEVSEKGIEQKIIRIQRSWYGLWHVTGAGLEMPGAASDHRLVFSDVLMADTDKETPLEDELTEEHFVYCGRDAVKPIEVSEELLNIFPINAAVQLKQSGSVYLLNITVYAPFDTWGGDPREVFALLQERGFIQAD